MSAIKTRTVPSLDKALCILELLTRSRAGLTLPELVEQSGLAKSSVHYLLVTLDRRGYVHRSDRTGRYMLGMRLFSLANSALSGLGLRQQAAPHLASLRIRTGLTIHMGILEQNEAVLISKHDAHGGMRVATWIGKRMDLHCTALGKALVAWLPEQAIETAIRERGLSRHNENTIANPRRLKEELEKAVRSGFTFDDEEDELGARCIGAPIFSSSDGRQVASVSIAGSASDITRENIIPLAEELKRTAAMIGQVIGEAESNHFAVEPPLASVAC